MELTDSINWNYEFDVVVIGSGNGAMTAGLVAHDHGAKVVLIEKSDKYGGTSASSGGGVWIPNNRYAKDAKAIDSIQDAKTYIQHVSPKGKIKEEIDGEFIMNTELSVFYDLYSPEILYSRGAGDKNRL